jgi:hypothetical protein
VNAPHYSGLAARLLKAQATTRSGSSAARERGIALIERATIQQRRSQRRWRALAGGLSVAAGLLLWAAWRAHREVPSTGEPLLAVASASGGAWISTGDGRLRLDTAIQLPSGARVTTMSEGSAQLELSTGTRLRLGGGADLRLARSTDKQRFVLSSGGVQANVHKLERGQHFVVVTPDSEIEVVGTAFQLSVLRSAQKCGDGLRTRLVVTEGVVDVRAEGRAWRVGPGQRWPADCAEETAVTETLPEPAAAATNDTAHGPAPEVTASLATPQRGQRRVSPFRASPVAAATTRQPSPLTPSHGPAEDGDDTARSTLASSVREQSDLFAEAAAAGRAGNTNQALQLYQELLTRFPGGALTENAVVSRMRLLARARPGAASAEAQRYLSRYPHGFARQEARGLISGP